MGDLGDCPGFGGSMGSIVIVGSSVGGLSTRSSNEILGIDGDGTAGWGGSAEDTGELDSVLASRSPKLDF